MLKVLENQFITRLKIILQSNVFYIIIIILCSFYTCIITVLVQHESIYLEDSLKINAKILDYSIDGDKLTLLLYNKEKFRATYYIKTAKEKDDISKIIKIGQTIHVEGDKSEVLGNTIPNTFNYQNYLKHNKISFALNINNYEFNNSKISIWNQLRNLVDNRIKKLGNNGYLKAFILGDKDLLDVDSFDKIQQNGVSHLLALSGMHISFLCLILNKLLSKFKSKKIIIYCFLFLYLIISGFSVSFLRAILFMLLVDLNNKFNFNVSKIKLLLLLACFLIFYNPYFIYNIGFWYTFVVTFSLLLSSKSLKNKNKISQMFFVSLITFLFSAPLTIYTNYEINLFSIINNLILVPYVTTLVFPFAILSFIFSPALNIFIILIKFMEIINSILNNLSLFIIFGKVNILLIIIYYVLLILFFILRKKQILLFLFLDMIVAYNQNIFDPNYYVFFLDVGQGDSAIFTSPRNKEVIMVDTGGKLQTKKQNFQIRNKEFNLADNIILYLKSMRIRKIDLLVLTHGDYDHVGYANDILNEIKVKNIMINNGDINKKEKDLIKGRNVVENYVSKEFVFKRLDHKLYDNENDNSIVLNVGIHNIFFLMMGDASQKVENDLMHKDIKANFIKIGHHGSNTSSSEEFINVVNPKYSIISVGKNNRYGHPKESVLNNLSNTKIYRTDLDGSIEIKINNKGYKIKTCAP